MNTKIDRSEVGNSGSIKAPSIDPLGFREYASVGEASKILGVSIDTIRRWDKRGLIRSERLDGKNRFFAVDDLEAFKATQKLSTTEVAKLLGISASSVRRLEALGTLVPQRDAQGLRMYEPAAVEMYRNGPIAVAFEEPVTEPTPQLIPEASLVMGDTVAANPTLAAPAPVRRPKAHKAADPGVVRRLWERINSMGRFQKILFWLTTGILTVVALFILLFLVAPGVVAQMLGYKSVTDMDGNHYIAPDKPGIVSRALSPITDTALSAASAINPDLNARVFKTSGADSVYFTQLKNGDIQPKYVVDFPSSAYVHVPDQGLVANLNSEFVDGYKPGQGSGNLAVVPVSGSLIQNKSITSSQIADGTIQLSNLSAAAISSLRGSGSSGGTTYTSGAQGPAGPTGSTGPAGPQGATGLQGPQGPAGSGTVDTVLAGQGLNGGGSASTVTLNVNSGSSTHIVNNALEVLLASSGTTSTTSSPSGLEVTGQGLRLLGGCGLNQILIWNGSGWACGAQSGGGGGSMSVQASDGSVIVANVGNLHFGPTSSSSTQFSITNIGGGGVRVQLGTNVLLTTNYASTLDSVYVNSGEAPAAGDITGNFNSGLQIGAGAVQLSTDTTGNYVATVTGGNGIMAAGSGSSNAPVTLALNLATSGVTGTSSSVSGLEIDSNGAARLLGGCSSGQTLKFNGTAWACGADNSSSLDVKQNGSTVTAAATAINFSTDFSVANSLSQANVGIDFATSGITRRGGTESIIGSWGFNDSSFTLQDNADNTKKAVFELAGVSAGTTRTLTVPDVNGTLITTGNLSNITTVGTVTSGTWQGTAVGVQHGGTGTTTLASNGILYGNGTGAVQASAAGTSGQLLLANAGSVPTFTSLSGDATLAATGALTVANAAITNAKLANSSLSVTAGTGLSGGGSVSLGGSSTGLSVVYGSTASSSAQGNTSIGFSGTGNLTGGITATAGGGVSANTLDVKANPSFSTSVTSPLFTGTGVTLSSTGAANDLILSSGRNITLSGFNCSTFNNGGVLTTDASGNIVCQNDDGGAAGTITGSGTTNRLPYYSGSSSLGDSWLLQNSTTMQLDSGKNFELVSGSLIAGGTTVLTSGRVLQNVTADAGIITAGILGSARGGTGVDGSAAANGQLLIGNSSGFSIGTLGTTGLTATTGSGTLSLAVNYGSGANNAAAGANSFTCNSGSGNLSGGGGTVTIGTSGTNCGAISLSATPSVSSLTATGSTTGLTVSGAPNNTGNTSLIQFGSAIASGNSAVNGGTYLGLNQPASGAGSAADFLNFQVNGTYKLKVDNTGLLDAVGGLSVGGTTVVTNARVLQNVTANASIITAGSLAATVGGTGQTSYSTGDLLYASNGTTLSKLAFGLTGQCLQAGATTPVWSGCASGSLFSVAGTSGSTQSVNGGNTVTFVAGNNINTTAAAGPNITIDTVNNPNFTTSVTTPSVLSSAALTISSGGTSGITMSTPGSSSANTGAITIQSGSAVTGSNLNAGTVSIDTGTKTGAGTAILNIGNTNAITLNIGNSNTAINLSGNGTITRAASGTTTLDLLDAGADTTFSVINSNGTKVANLNLSDGALQIGGTSVLTAGRVLQNVTTDASIITTGTVGVARGGTGLGSYTTGDLLYASAGTTLASLADAATGNVLISGGAGAAPSYGKVTLGTHTSGNYLASLGSVTGLTLGGTNGVAGGVPTLSVNYGSGANNAAAGANTFVCPSGTGNLTGTGNTVTIGTSGTTCTALDTVAAPTFSGLLTASKTGANAFAVTGAPVNTATSSLIQIGGAIAGGNTVANGGT
jgi:excisionase family DNA binding protein